MNKSIDRSTVSPLPDASGYDLIEDRLRANVRATIETIFEEELAEFLGRIRYGRGVSNPSNRPERTACGGHSVVIALILALVGIPFVPDFIV